MNENPSPLVSAIIPVYNGEKYVREAVESVLKQTYPNLECIVVDDGSQDATPEVVKRFGERVRYIRKTNGGVSSARNAGAAIANGEFLAFLDADDLWISEKTALQVQPLIDDPALAMVYSTIQVVDSQLRPIGLIHAAPNGSGLKNSLLMELPIMSCNSGMIRKSHFAAIGGFDERLSTSADTDFSCRLACRYPVVPLHVSLLLYRQHGKQMHLNVDVLKHDQLIICAKLFGTGVLPPELDRLRRRALANLYSTMSIQYFHDGRLFRGIRSALQSAIYHPLRPFAAAIRLVSNRLRGIQDDDPHTVESPRSK
jgi:glycosyltransferase involved in cell wall biosynthesis